MQGQRRTRATRVSTMAAQQCMDDGRTVIPRRFCTRAGQSQHVRGHASTPCRVPRRMPVSRHHPRPLAAAPCSTRHRRLGAAANSGFFRPRRQQLRGDRAAAVVEAVATVVGAAGSPGKDPGAGWRRVVAQPGRVVPRRRARACRSRRIRWPGRRPCRPARTATSINCREALVVRVILGTSR